MERVEDRFAYSSLRPEVVEKNKQTEARKKNVHGTTGVRGFV